MPQGIYKKIIGTCICGKCPEVPEYTKEEILEKIGYQEDIKAGVEVGDVTDKTKLQKHDVTEWADKAYERIKGDIDKTEQIRDLRKEFITWYKLKVSDFEWVGEEEIADWWLQKLSEQRQSILEEVEGLRKSEFGDKYSSSVEDITFGFNQALDTVLTILRK